MAITHVNDIVVILKCVYLEREDDIKLTVGKKVMQLSLYSTIFVYSDFSQVPLSTDTFQGILSSFIGKLVQENSDSEYKER